MRKNLLLLCMALMTAVSASAYDFSALNEDGVTIFYNINHDRMSVTVTYANTDYGSYDFRVLIPPVVKDGTTPYIVTAIGDEAFKSCPNVDCVYIPNTVTSIGSNAFADCAWLRRLFIPESVTSIGSGAFSGCTHLYMVSVDNANPSNIKLGSNNIFDGLFLSEVTLCVPKESMGLYEKAPVWKKFAYVSELPFDFTVSTNTLATLFYCKVNSDQKSVTLVCRESIYSAFSNYYSGNIVIPETVTNDGTAYTVTAIGRNAMRECKSIKNVTIPQTVTSIGDGAFQSCSGLTEISFPGSLTDIGNLAFFQCQEIVSVTIPESVENVGYGAFADCASLKEFKGKFASADGRCLIIGTTINSFAFNGLTSYTIPAGIKSIGRDAFSESRGLEEVVLSDGLESIGHGAFWYCFELKNITIPASVSLIEDWAFSFCTDLEYIKLKNTDPELITVGEYVFEGAKIFRNCILYVPLGCAEKYGNCDPWNEFTNIEEYELSGIGDLQGESLNEAELGGDMYDLSGRRVSNPVAGLYISNGRKVIVK